MRIVNAIILALFVAGLACSCGPGGRQEQSHPLSAFTPKDIAEAEYVALYLSGELLAPEEVYQRVAGELSAIRGTFGVEFPSVQEIEFWPPWEAGSLDVYFDSTSKPQVVSGGYAEWDELNQSYDLSSKSLEFLDPFDFVTLHFNGRLHPRRLEEEYVELPGIVHANPCNPSPLSDSNSNLYPGQVAGQMVYLFDHCWNQGIDRHYLYFGVEQGQVSLIGQWQRLGSCLDEHHEECFQNCLSSCSKGGSTDCQDVCGACWLDYCDDYCPEYFAEPDWWQAANGVQDLYRSL